MLGIPPGAVAAAGAQSIQQRPSGIAALLSDPALQQALLGTGTALLQQSDRPGTLGGALGRALPVGLNAFNQQRAGQAEADEKAAKMREFEALLASLGMSPEQTAVMRFAGPDAATGPLMETLNPPPADPFTLGTGDTRFSGDGTEIATGGPDVPPTAAEYVAAQGLGFEGSYEDFLAARRGAGVNVHVGGEPSPIQNAANSVSADLVSTGFRATETNVATMGTMDQLLAITEDPEFAKVSGPLWGGSFGELASRFSDDPQARQLAAQFRAGGGRLTMAQLELFTGPKTDFEFMQAERLAQADRTMTVEEIRAGLRFNRKFLQDQNERWAERMLGLDLAGQNVDPGTVQPQLDLARSIRPGGDVAGRFNLPPRPGGGS